MGKCAKTYSIQYNSAAFPLLLLEVRRYGDSRMAEAETKTRCPKSRGDISVKILKSINCGSDEKVPRYIKLKCTID